MKWGFDIFSESLLVRVAKSNLKSRFLSILHRLVGAPDAYLRSLSATCVARTQLILTEVNFGKKLNLWFY